MARSMAMSPQYLQMLKAALASFAQQPGRPSPGQPGSAVTPEMAAVAQQNLPGTNFQGATVAGVEPGAPPFPQGPSMGSAIGAAAPALAQIARSAGGGADPRERAMRKLPPHYGQGTQPKPISPMPAPPAQPAAQTGAPQAGGPGVPSVGQFLTSPAGQALMQQMQKALGIGAR